MWRSVLLALIGVPCLVLLLFVSGAIALRVVHLQHVQVTLLTRKDTLVRYKESLILEVNKVRELKAKIARLKSQQPHRQAARLQGCRRTTSQTFWRSPPTDQRDPRSEGVKSSVLTSSWNPSGLSVSTARQANPRTQRPRPQHP